MTKVGLDRMMVIDVEETCWDGEPPQGEAPEIIQVGVAELLLTGTPRIGRVLCIDVRPVLSMVSPFCTGLTGITPGTARKGRPLQEAMATINRTFGGPGRTWAAWGRDDVTIREGCAAQGIETPQWGGFLDLGATWSMLVGGGKAVGLRQAMATLGLEFQGIPHRALDDAVNTARVAVALACMVRGPRTAVVPGPGTGGRPGM